VRRANPACKVSRAPRVREENLGPKDLRDSRVRRARSARSVRLDRRVRRAIPACKVSRAPGVREGNLESRGLQGPRVREENLGPKDLPGLKAREARSAPSVRLDRRVREGNRGPTEPKERWGTLAPEGHRDRRATKVILALKDHPDPLLKPETTPRRADVIFSPSRFLAIFCFEL